MKKLPEPHYAGELSKDFWQVVNHEVPKDSWGELYALGVALQNLEHQVLKAMRDSMARTPSTEETET